MRILIVAATDLEIDAYRAANPDLDYLVTGVGVPAAIFHLSMALMNNTYQLVVQAGIAGSFHYDEGSEQVSVVQADRFADLGVYEDGSMYTIAEKKIAAFEFPFDVDGWLVNPHVEKFITPASALVKAITVNMITDDKKMNGIFESKWNAAIETMEGAAFHYCCLQHDIPFVQVRATSNRVGERDKNKWNIPAALENLHAGLDNIIATAKNISF